MRNFGGMPWTEAERPAGRKAVAEQYLNELPNWLEAWISVSVRWAVEVCLERLKFHPHIVNRKLFCKIV